MARRWCFHEGRTSRPNKWTWRILRVDGTIERISEQDFKEYGAVVLDAIRNGFRPKQDHWIIESTSSVVHFRHGEQSVVVSKVESPGVGMRRIRQSIGQREVGAIRKNKNPTST